MEGPHRPAGEQHPAQDDHRTPLLLAVEASLLPFFEGVAVLFAACEPHTTVPVVNEERLHPHVVGERGAIVQLDVSDELAVAVRTSDDGAGGNQNRGRESCASDEPFVIAVQTSMA